MMPLANILELFLDCTTDPHIVGRQDTVVYTDVCTIETKLPSLVYTDVFIELEQIL